MSVTAALLQIPPHFLTLGEKQRIFAYNVAQLIVWAYEQNYAISLGEAQRDPRIAELNAKEGKGISNSLHLIRLAIDLNLFKDGVFLTASEDHRPLGTYWKTLHVLNRWGGEFAKPDGNHYAMSHEGRA